MNATHTHPAPWTPQRWWQQAGMTLDEADPDERADWQAAPIKSIVDADGNNVVSCHDLASIDPDVARLIAAAPAMRDELTHILDLLRTVIDSGALKTATNVPEHALGVMRVDAHDHIASIRTLLATIDGQEDRPPSRED